MPQPRTLIRIEEVNTETGDFHVIVPGWNVREKVRLLLKDLPSELRDLIKPGKRLHARVNVECENAKELVFCDWETS